MAKYRTLTDVTYVKDGAVITQLANRFIELTDEQAAALGASVEKSIEEDGMFPGGAPVIPAGFLVESDAPAVDPRSLVSGLPAPKAKK